MPPNVLGRSVPIGSDPHWHMEVRDSAGSAGAPSRPVLGENTPQGSKIYGLVITRGVRRYDGGGWTVRQRYAVTHEA